MERTQIYLTEEQARALESRSRETGRSKSQLIREAIDGTYLPNRRDRQELLKAIRAAAGSWRGRRESGAEYVDRVRPGRLNRVQRTRKS